MDIDKIMQLIDKVNSSANISSLTVEEGCLKISIEKAVGTAVATEGDQVVRVPVSPAVQQAVQTSEIVQNTQKAAERAFESEEMVEESILITSPIVGVFYSAPGPEEAPFVKVGDTVEKGQIVGIVEAMKLMNEIESDVSGIVEEILVENGESVEYGQPLFRLK